LNRNQNDRQRGAKDRNEQKSKNGVYYAATAIAFPISIILHAPAGPNSAVKDLPKLVQNVRAGAHVPTGSTLRVSQAAEEVNLELPPAAALRTRLTCEIAEPNGYRGVLPRRLELIQILFNGRLWNEVA
jgi:hypothetical protein